MTVVSRLSKPVVIFYITVLLFLNLIRKCFLLVPLFHDLYQVYIAKHINARSGNVCYCRSGAAL